MESSHQKMYIIKLLTLQLMQKNKYESNYTICVGQGYDVHKLIPGKYIKLFGVKIPFNLKFNIIQLINQSINYQ